MEIQEITRVIEQRDQVMIDRLTKLDKGVEKIEGLAARFDDFEQRAARRGSGGDYAPQTWGRAMVESDEFKALAASKRGTARIEVKTTLTTTGASGMVPSDERLDPIVIPRRRLGIRDLLSRGQTSSNSIRYVKMTSRSNSARVQSEGTPKAEQALDFTPHTADVTTIAAWLPASKQILDDAPALMALIDAELRYAVDYAEETEILLGDGTGEHLFGLIPQATAYAAPFTPVAPQMIDAILLAKAQLEVGDLMATGVVLNPLDWAKIRSLKDGDNKYLIGSPLTDVAPRLWDIAVVTSNSIDQDKFLLGDFKRAAILFERQSMTIEVSTEHSDFFTRNLVAVRAEKRVALAVQQSAATIWGDFGLVT